MADVPGTIAAFTIDRIAYSPSPPVAFAVVALLETHFTRLVDYEFTARMEEQLDEVAAGTNEWVPMVRAFWDPFSVKIAEGRANIAKQVEVTDIVCPLSGDLLVKRFGRNGWFLGCSGYPECKYIKKEPPKGTGVPCPECKQGELVERRGRFGNFFSCSRYPQCAFAVNQQPFPEPCPNCGGLVVAARGGARRCIACKRAWDEGGSELPEEEAQKLIPKPRAGSPKPAGSRSGSAKARAGTRARSAAGPGGKRSRSRKAS